MQSLLLATLTLLALAHAELGVYRHPPSHNGWQQSHRASPDTPLAFSLLLRHDEAGYAQLEQLAMRVSDPDDELYGQHLTAAQVADLIAPPHAHVAALESWVTNAFGAAGLAWTSATRDLLHVRTTVAQAESVLGVELFHYTNTRPGSEHARLLRTPHLNPTNALPAEFGIVHALHGVFDFPPVPRYLGVKASADDPGMDVTPPVIRKKYGVPSGPTPSNQSTAVAEFEQAYFYQRDLNAFQAQYGLEVANATVYGPNDPENGYLGEASLDVEYIVAVTTSMPNYVFSQDQFDLVTWANKVLSTTPLVRVHSVSWGSGESGYSHDTLGQNNAAFAKLAAMGITVLVASGDQGTGHTGVFSCGAFDPTHPATSPWVLAVGGTYTASESADEAGWESSGGGFSNFFTRPSYQADAVSAYLSSSAPFPDQKYWNRTGRATPDVSALATNYQVLIQNFTGPLSGTSAATPVFAGLLALINAEREAAGKSPLGFVSPLLYKAGKVGFDVTQGNNKNPSCPTGFAATAGYDAITGLGTPLYATLESILLNA